MYTTIASATSAHASSSPTAAGTHRRRPNRSSSSHAARTGTTVPTWSGDSSSTCVPTPSCGASIRPAAISIRIQPCVPAAPPLASSAASAVSTVYVRAAPMCTTSAFSPCASSTSMYSGSSVV